MRRRILTDVIPLTKVGVGQVVTYAHWGNEEEDTYICPSSETLILSPLCPTAERRRILTYVRVMRRRILTDVIPLTKILKSHGPSTRTIFSLSLKGHEEEDTYICHSTETNSLTNSSDCPCVLTKPYP